MKKYTFSISLSALIIGVVSFISPALAVAPATYGLHEGDLISAANSNDPDIYIINEQGYKRLFLNPVIFSFYGHLGGFANVKVVTPAVRDAFQTSTLFRNCETNDPQIYAIEVNGEDSGTLHSVQISGSVVVQQDPDFFKKVFCINNNESQWYPRSPMAYMSVSQILPYARRFVPNPLPTPFPFPNTNSSPTPTPIPGYGGGGMSTPTPTPLPTPIPTPTPIPGPQVVTISIQNFSFFPGTLNVNPGDIIRFTNLDSFMHSAVDDTNQWMTPVLSQGQSYDLNTSMLPVGTYRYHCGIHGAAMVGTIRIGH